MDPLEDHESVGRAYRKAMRRRENASDLRFITFSTDERRPWFLDPVIAQILAERLAATRAVPGLLLYAWVIMPEHVHVLVRAAGAPWSTVARSFKTQVARSALEYLRQSVGPPPERFWQHGGGFDRNVRDMTEFTRAIRYIHLNPVARGLVERPEDWRWSSVRWWMGRREGEIVCDPPPGDPRKWAAWKGYV